MIFGVIGFGLSSDAFAKGGGQPKVTICHVDQETGEEKTISISNKAVSKHIANHLGDHLGECADEPEPFCEPNICDDNNECTIDVCDEAGDTCSNDVNEGVACGTAGTCDAGGVCVEPPLFCEPNICDDANECTIDVCDEAGDTCSNNIDEGTACGTAGTCDAGGQCVEPFCGDGNVDAGETCDDAGDNGKPGFCNATCDGIEPTVTCQSASDDFAVPITECPDYQCIFDASNLFAEQSATCTGDAFGIPEQCFNDGAGPFADCLDTTVALNDVNACIASWSTAVEACAF